MKKTNALKITALILTILALCLSLAGSIMMFTDSEDIYSTKTVIDDYTYNWKTGKWGFTYKTVKEYSYTRDCPETGAMPLVGFILITASLVLFCLSFKKNNKTLIASIVLSFCSLPLLLASIALWSGDNDVAFTGYQLCAVGGSVVFIASILKTVYAVLLKKAPAVAVHEVATENNAPIASDLDSKTDSLRKLKELLDMGAIGQEDFDAKKKEILER